MEDKIRKSHNIDGYDLMNHEKYERVVNGVVGKEGELIGGIGDDASDSDILAQYDKLGGLIKKGNYKVKTGSFYDFGRSRAKGKKRETPDVHLVFTTYDEEGNAQIVEIHEDEVMPPEVLAAEQARENKSQEERTKTESEASKRGIKFTNDITTGKLKTMIKKHDAVESKFVQDRKVAAEKEAELDAKAKADTADTE